MTAPALTVSRVRLLVEEALGVDVPDDSTDLIASGLLDSLALVSLIAGIEDEFNVELPLEELDVDDFRSVDRIAEHLSATQPTADGPRDQRSPFAVLTSDERVESRGDHALDGPQERH
jgi:acyl carrier protein